MKKLISILNIFVLGIILLSSCELNSLPKFDDNDAFAAFNNATMSVSEQGSTISIPVTLASVAGLERTVSYTVTDGTAKAGTNFSLADGSGTVTFNSTTRTAYIVINIVDKPNVFTGDLKFTLTLNASNDLAVGKENACVVTIKDADHPLANILGDYEARGTSYFNGSTQWTVTFEKDASDVSVVWISNFVDGGSSLAVYGIVNDAKTEIKIPAGQEIAQSSSYPFIELRAFYGPDGDVEIDDGAYITIDINADYSMVIEDEIGSYVWKNAAKTSGAGWYNIFKSGITLTRQ